ncbi:MAG: hypothetical protein HXS52_02095 [Theionarchaea archaeon]|nr:hypothetical protein [Theionarchaea archaeon]MBU7036695.1 hypothetical protein [Theionarchaea archaeon]
MDDKLGEEIIRKLEMLIRITAISAVRDESLEDKIRILSTAGLKNTEIADILGKSQSNIGVRLSMIRKKKAKIVENECEESQQ